MANLSKQQRKINRIIEEKKRKRLLGVESRRNSCSHYYLEPERRVFFPQLNPKEEPRMSRWIRKAISDGYVVLVETNDERCTCYLIDPEGFYVG